MSLFECDCCGACCRGTLIVEADEIDALREPRLLTACITDWGQAKTPAELLAHLAEGFGACLIIAGNQPCKFVGEDNLCSIYPTRPNACVAMQAGDEQCQLARASAGLGPLLPREQGGEQ
jgi:Fe-S-cluster containining protein